MREEDLDWLCYTTLSRGTGSATIPELARAVGADEEAVAASAARLVHYLLAQQNGERIQLLSAQESLLACQIRYSGDLPLVLENGVVRVKGPDGP